MIPYAEQLTPMQGIYAVQASVTKETPSIANLLLLFVVGITMIVEDKQRMNQFTKEQQAKLLELKPYLKPILDELRKIA